MAFNAADKVTLAAATLIGYCKSLENTDGTLISPLVINEEWVKSLLE